MANQSITQGGPGPQGSGEQGVPGGGSGSKNPETGALHYTDHDQQSGSHHSWNEKGGEISDKHTTQHSKK